MAHAADRLGRHLLTSEGRDALSDVLCQVADALQVAGDSQDRRRCRAGLLPVAAGWRSWRSPSPRSVVAASPPVSRCRPRDWPGRGRAWSRHRSIARAAAPRSHPSRQPCARGFADRRRTPWSCVQRFPVPSDFSRRPVRPIPDPVSPVNLRRQQSHCGSGLRAVVRCTPERRRAVSVAITRSCAAMPLTHSSEYNDHMTRS